ncbi:MAG: DPP IV N-terminal domain-containing protein, partial [Planctomycetota bacterium]
MKNFLLLLSAAICLTVSSLELTTSVLGQEAENQDSELQLEKLFPPTSMFGPSASRMAFSADGRYGAYLYRDYLNRRHGRDLWIHDFKTDKTTQITNIEMLAEFQRSSRLVIEDRKKKSRKDSSRNKSKAKGDDDNDEKEDETESEAEENNKEIAKASGEDAKSDEQESLEVSEKDGKDYYAPAYSGISSFRWHPEENALLISSENDLYWMEDITKPNLVRLTKTDQRESSYSFTPDGDGITYQAGDTVFQLNFGEHFVGQINPKIPSGDSLGGYEITEDGSRMALICYSGSRASSSRTVDIIRYRDRFAKSDKISRTVSDDEVPERKVKIYMVSLDEGEFEFESAPLIKIFEETIDEPRDVISNPKWSLDGNHITFGFFNQEDSEVDIRMATWPTDEELKKATEKAVSKREKKEAEQAAENKKKDEKDRTPGRRGNSGGRTKAPELLEHDSKIVYQYKHYGGPNTPRQLAPNFDAKNHIVFVSEQSGYRHIHSLDPLYENLRQLTSGRFEVYPIRMSKDRKTLFVTSTKQTAARQMVYALDLESGEFTRLNSEDGNYS